MGEPRIRRWLSYLMQVSHGIGNIGGVPEDDRGDDEVEPRGAKLLLRIARRDKPRPPVYGWFTEGFDTADLKDAKRLLDELT
jgi:hypothetical protein